MLIDYLPAESQSYQSTHRQHFEMSADKMQAIYGLVFGLASIIIAILALLIAVLQFWTTRQTQARVPVLTWRRT